MYILCICIIYKATKKVFRRKYLGKQLVILTEFCIKTHIVGWLSEACKKDTPSQFCNICKKVQVSTQHSIFSLTYLMMSIQIEPLVPFRRVSIFLHYLIKKLLFMVSCVKKNMQRINENNLLHLFLKLSLYITIFRKI